MLLTDKEALEKAKSIIKEKNVKDIVTRFFWIKAENEEDDIFCYYVKNEELNEEYLPGMRHPLFKRNGEMTDFLLPIPA